MAGPLGPYFLVPAPVAPGCQPSNNDQDADNGVTGNAGPHACQPAPAAPLPMPLPYVAPDAFSACGPGMAMPMPCEPAMPIPMAPPAPIQLMPIPLAPPPPSNFAPPTPAPVVPAPAPPPTDFANAVQNASGPSLGSIAMHSAPVIGNFLNFKDWWARDPSLKSASADSYFRTLTRNRFGAPGPVSSLSSRWDKGLIGRVASGVLKNRLDSRQKLQEGLAMRQARRQEEINKLNLAKAEELQPRLNAMEAGQVLTKAQQKQFARAYKLQKGEIQAAYSRASAGLRADARAERLMGNNVFTQNVAEAKKLRLKAEIAGLKGDSKTALEAEQAAKDALARGEIEKANHYAKAEKLDLAAGKGGRIGGTILKAEAPFTNLTKVPVAGRALKVAGGAAKVAAPALSIINGVMDAQQAATIMGDTHASGAKKLLAVGTVALDVVGGIAGFFSTPVALAANVASLGTSIARDDVH